MSRSLAFTLHDVDVWMYPENYESGTGPLMPTPDHAQDTLGMGDSYAHMFDGTIMRFQEVIGTKADLVKVD